MTPSKDEGQTGLKRPLMFGLKSHLSKVIRYGWNALSTRPTFFYTKIPNSLFSELEDNKASSTSIAETVISRPLNINKVPLEIWMNIVRWLPPSSAASLVFSCKKLLYLIGDKPWKDLEAVDMKGDKLQFLSWLESDLPSHILCPHCIIYRPACRITSTTEEELCNGLGWFLSRRPECAFKHRRAPAVKHSFEVALDEDHVIDWWLVQMVIRNQYLAPSPGVSADQLTFKWESQLRWQHSSTAAIVAGKLLVKFNSELHINALYEDLYYRNTSAFTCGHSVSPFLDEMCRCALRHVQQSASKSRRVLSFELCDRCSSIHRCADCASEYWIRVRKVSVNQHLTQSLPNNVIISLTRYIDLGSGQYPPTKVWDFWMNRPHMQSSIWTEDLPDAGHQRHRPSLHNSTRAVEESAHIQRRFEASVGKSIPMVPVRTIGSP